MMEIPDVLDTELQAELIDAYHSGRLTPRQAMNHCRDRGVGIGVIDTYDMADWLRNTEPPSVSTPVPKKAAKKKASKST